MFSEGDLLIIDDLFPRKNMHEDAALGRRGILTRLQEWDFQVVIRAKNIA
jgi:hypothetical protein